MSSPKIKFSHLFIVMLFQTCLTFFIKELNIIEDEKCFMSIQRKSMGLMLFVNLSHTFCLHGQNKLQCWLYTKMFITFWFKSQRLSLWHTHGLSCILPLTEHRELRCCKCTGMQAAGSVLHISLQPPLVPAVWPSMQFSAVPPEGTATGFIVIIYLFSDL